MLNHKSVGSLLDVADLSYAAKNLVEESKKKATKVFENKVLALEPR